MARLIPAVARAFSVVSVLLAIQAPPAYAQPVDFLALDLSGGFVTHGMKGSEDGNTTKPARGFELGGSLRLKPWFGVTATGSRTAQGERSFLSYAIGPRFTTPYSNGYPSYRGFAHVLVGSTRMRAPSLPNSSAIELIVGSGFDAFGVVRFQFDYMHLSLSDAQKNSSGVGANALRFHVGAVVPLCFRGCRNEPFDLSANARSVP